MVSAYAFWFSNPTPNLCRDELLYFLVWPPITGRAVELWSSLELLSSLIDSTLSAESSCFFMDSLVMIELWMVLRLSMLSFNPCSKEKRVAWSYAGLPLDGSGPPCPCLRYLSVAVSIIFDGFVRIIRFISLKFSSSILLWSAFILLEFNDLPFLIFPISID